jgi:aminoglycoside phosphotransferase (APT) family kinase protein
MNLISDQAQKWIIQSIGNDCTIQSITPLRGATSSSLYQITFRHSHDIFNVVLRLFTNSEWLKAEPDLALHEANSLQMAEKLPINTPRLIAIDEKGEHCGVPAILMTKVEGTIHLFPKNTNHWTAQLAHTLLQIHSFQPKDFPWMYFRYYDVEKLDPPYWSNHKKQWEEAIEHVIKHTPEDPLCFLHRDFHPMNVLWQNDNVSGVVDWVNACIGPAGVDLGHCRLNLALLYGIEVADQFLYDYLKVAEPSFVYNPYWDLNAIFDFSPVNLTVYKGWLDYGVKGLTDEVVRTRMDQYILHILKKL